VLFRQWQVSRLAPRDGEAKTHSLSHSHFRRLFTRWADNDSVSDLLQSQMLVDVGPPPRRQPSDASLVIGIGNRQLATN